jgi:hypothetical protein
VARGAVVSGVEAVVTFKVTIPESWYDKEWLGSHGAYAWLSLVEIGERWDLVREDTTGLPGPDSVADEAYAAYNAAMPLPAGWFYFGRAALTRAYLAGVRRWGEDFYKTADASKRDICLQLALLGEVRYG